MLIDLGGTIFFRTGDKDARACEFNEKIAKYMYFYRPGYRELLSTLHKDPRVKLAFYSSIMAKNIVPIMTRMCEDEMLQPLAQSLTIFD